jgi:hypothetical protein
MQRYVIERDLPGIGDLSIEALRQASIGSNKAIRSHVTENRLYCEYLAASEQIVREHAARCGLPANRVSRVRHVMDPMTANPPGR